MAARAIDHAFPCPELQLALDKLRQAVGDLWREPSFEFHRSAEWCADDHTRFSLHHDESDGTFSIYTPNGEQEYGTKAAEHERLFRAFLENA